MAHGRRITRRAGAALVLALLLAACTRMAIDGMNGSVTIDGQG